MAVTNEQLQSELVLIKTILESRMGGIEVKLSETMEKVDHIDHDIRGNSSPGMKERLSYVEKVIKALMAVSGAAAITLIVDVIMRIVQIVYKG